MFSKKNRFFSPMESLPSKHAQIEMSNKSLNTHSHNMLTNLTILGLYDIQHYLEIFLLRESHKPYLLYVLENHFVLPHNLYHNITY